MVDGREESDAAALASAVLTRTVAAVRDVQSELTQADPDALRRRPADGEWSAIEVAGHLVDKFRVWAHRIARAVTEDRPTAEPYDQDALVAGFGYVNADLDLLLTEVDGAGQRFIRVVADLPPGADRRVMVHGEYGDLIVADAARMVLDSLDDHLDQLRRALAG